MVKSKKWGSKPKSIKQTVSSVDGLRYEITGRANGAGVSMSRKMHKDLIVRTSKVGQKKTPASNRSTAIVYAPGAILGSTKTPKSMKTGKSLKKVKWSSIDSPFYPTPIKRKTASWKPFTGSKNLMSKQRFSLLDIVVVLAIVKLVIYLLEHLTIHWN